MTKIPDELLEAEFTKAHEYTSTISASLEHLEEAISNENYPEASDQFGLVLQNVDKLKHAIEGPIGGLVDAITPGPKDDPHKLKGVEIQTLILSLSRGQDTFTDEDAETLVEWAREIRTNQAILELALRGDIVASIGADGGVYFDLPGRRKS